MRCATCFNSTFIQLICLIYEAHLRDCTSNTHWIQFSSVNDTKMIRTKVRPSFILFVFVCLVYDSFGGKTSDVNDVSLLSIIHRIYTVLDIDSTCPVYLTISSKSKNVEDSPIIINWGPACRNPPKWIGLYDKDPSGCYGDHKVYVETNNNQQGIFETNVTIGQLILPDGWSRDDALKRPPKRNNGKCLPFYVASFDDDAKTLRSMDCLKIQPNWMNANTHLMDVPLKNIFLPG